MKASETSRQSMHDNNKSYDYLMDRYDCFRAYLEHLYGYRYLESLGFNPNFQSNLCYILSIYKEDLDRCKTYNDKFKYMLANNLISYEDLADVLNNIFENLIEQAGNDDNKIKIVTKMKTEITIIDLKRKIKNVKEFSDIRVSKKGW